MPINYGMQELYEAFIYGARINLLWSYINFLIYIVHTVAMLIGWVTYGEEEKAIWGITVLFMLGSLFGVLLAMALDSEEVKIELASRPFSYFMGTSLVLFFNAMLIYIYWRDILPFG